MITRSNYESFFLDYHEGNLSEALKEELFEFLALHPDLREELEQFASITLDPAPTVFIKKDSLLKKNSVVDAGDTERLIALHEGDLSSADARRLQSRFEQEPALRQESEFIARLHIVPDLRVRFPDINSLKKTGRVIAFHSRVYQSLSIAAAIILILLLYVYIRNGERPMTAERQPVPAGTPESTQSQVTPDRKQQETEFKFSGFPIDTSLAVVESPHHEPIVPLREKTPAYAAKALTKQPVLETTKLQPEALTSTPQSERQPEQVPVQETLFTQDTLEQSVPVSPVGLGHNTESLADIFSDQELAELGLHKEPAAKDGSVWRLIQKGTRKFSQATGTHIVVDRQSDPFTQSNTYALAIGKLSIRRTGQ